MPKDREVCNSEESSLLVKDFRAWNAVTIDQPYICSARWRTRELTYVDFKGQKALIAFDVDTHLATAR
jgi:hypothetical protein